MTDAPSKRNTLHDPSMRLSVSLHYILFRRNLDFFVEITFPFPLNRFIYHSLPRNRILKPPQKHPSKY
jgi:hypothetical protein